VSRFCLSVAYLTDITQVGCYQAVTCVAGTVPAAAANEAASTATASRRRATPDDKSNRGLSDGLRKVIRLQLSMIATNPSAATTAPTSAAAPNTAPPASNGWNPTPSGVMEIGSR